MDENGTGRVLRNIQENNKTATTDTVPLSTAELYVRHVRKNSIQVKMMSLGCLYFEIGFIPSLRQVKELECSGNY